MPRGEGGRSPPPPKDGPDGTDGTVLYGHWEWTGRSPPYNKGGGDAPPSEKTRQVKKCQGTYLFKIDFLKFAPRVIHQLPHQLRLLSPW